MYNTESNSDIVCIAFQIGMAFGDNCLRIFTTYSRT